MSGASPPAAVFAALGDPTRLGLVARLCSGGPLSIARLTEGADVTRQAVTKHLHVLQEAGLVRSLRQGRESVWEMETRRLEAAPLKEATEWLERYRRFWEESFNRLDELLQEMKENEDAGKK